MKHFSQSLKATATFFVFNYTEGFVRTLATFTKYHKICAKRNRLKKAFGKSFRKNCYNRVTNRHKILILCICISNVRRQKNFLDNISGLNLKISSNSVTICSKK